MGRSEGARYCRDDHCDTNAITATGQSNRLRRHTHPGRRQGQQSDLGCAKPYGSTAKYCVGRRQTSSLVPLFKTGYFCVTNEGLEPTLSQLRLRTTSRWWVRSRLSGAGSVTRTNQGFHLPAIETSATNTRVRRLISRKSILGSNFRVHSP